MLKDSYFYLCKKIYTCNIDTDYKSLEFLFSIYSDTLGNIRYVCTHNYGVQFVNYYLIKRNDANYFPTVVIIGSSNN